MSKGNTIVQGRISAELYSAVVDAIARSATTRKEGPWTVSTFVEAAIAEKIDKMRRGRGNKGRRPSLFLRDLDV